MTDKAIAIQQLIDRCGGQEAFAQQMGVTQAAVSKWLIKGCVPISRAVQIERMFGAPAASTISSVITDAIPERASVTEPRTDKAKAIALLKLLSALESWSFSTKESLPDYLHEDLARMVEWLEKEILR